MADLAHRHLAVTADTVWFCFYYYQRSVVRAIYCRRWEVLRQVLGVKTMICVRSAPNLVILSGLSTHGALSGVQTNILYLLWLKTKTISYPFEMESTSLSSRIWFGKFCHFKLQITLSLPVTWLFIWYQEVAVHSKYLWTLNHAGFSVEQEIFKIESLEVL